MPIWGGPAAGRPARCASSATRCLLQGDASTRSTGAWREMGAFHPIRGTGCQQVGCTELRACFRPTSTCSVRSERLSPSPAFPTRISSRETPTDPDCPERTGTNPVPSVGCGGPISDPIRRAPAPAPDPIRGAPVPVPDPIRGAPVKAPDPIGGAPVVASPDQL